MFGAYMKYIVLRTRAFEIIHYKTIMIDMLKLAAAAAAAWRRRPPHAHTSADAKQAHRLPNNNFVPHTHTQFIGICAGARVHIKKCCI